MTADEKSALDNFPITAEEFCHLVDGYSKRSREQLVQELSVHLARLCEVGVRLPMVEPATEGVDATPEAVTAHTEEWTKLSSGLRQVFGQLDGYWEIFEPTEKEEPVLGSLANDIAEIYLDLKDALKLLESGNAPDDIHWDWRFEFHSHWSKHAASALKVLLHISDVA